LTSNHTAVLSAITLPLGGRLLVGHVDEAGRDDPAVSIPAREYRFGDFFADARCRSCPARSELSQRGDEALLLIIHRDDCPQLAVIRAELDDAGPGPMRPMEIEAGEEL
jgi:hypothetical protein